jgi:hypothetical protein
MASLNEIPKKTPFKIPENYFEEVNRKILSSASEVAPERNKVRFIHRFRTQLAVAASITGLVILSYAGFRLITHDRVTSQISEIFSIEDKESILNEIDILTLEENISSSDLPAETSELNSKEIIDYLLLENIEISDIYEKL